MKNIKVYGFKLKLQIVSTLFITAFFKKELTQIEMPFKIRTSLTSYSIKLMYVNNGENGKSKGNEHKAATMYQNGIHSM